MSAQPTPSKERRFSSTRFLVPDPAFRWFVGTFGLGSAGIAGFFGTLSWWYHRRLVGGLSGGQTANLESLPQMIDTFSQSSITIIVIAAVGTCLFMTLLSMFLIHRITGPAYRLRRHMLDIVMGRQPTPLSFRESDRMSDLGAAYNELMGHFGLIERPSPGAADPAETSTGSAQRLVARARS